VGESVAAVAEALAALARTGEVAMPSANRWLGVARWQAARDAVEAAVREYATQHPARYGVMKGELKSALKSSVDGALFDAAFTRLVTDGVLEQTGERVRPAGMPWQPPADVLALLEKLERLLEAEGYLVPENATWAAALGAGATEAASLGFFLGRLVRVNMDLTYTAGQMARLRASLAEWFATHDTLSVSDLRGFTGASRKFAVPLLEHCDRLLWTVRVGDERKRGKLE
ncbi:MAG: SelB C-terminal domain-containing protein, partial [Phycisphaerales bacterium]|nr:SelB C-terminal domain-containing protein [Phycisphaerales bacterium]